MKSKTIVYKVLSFSIAIVWIINGLFCKLFKLVPRHQQIVAGIMGNEHSGLLTKAIGVAEIVMAIWILSGIKTRLNAIVQIVVIASMNVLEFLLVPDLLLWGKYNIVFAFIFTLIIYLNEFNLKKKLAQQG